MPINTRFVNGSRAIKKSAARTLVVVVDVSEKVLVELEGSELGSK